MTPFASASASFRAVVPLVVSVASHGVGAIVLVSMNAPVAVEEPQASFIELVATSAPAPNVIDVAPPVAPTPAPDTPQRPRDPNTPVAPDAVPDTPPPDQAPSYEQTGSVADVLRAPEGTSTSFSLIDPAAVAGAIDLPGRPAQQDLAPPTLAEREQAIEDQLAARLRQAANARAYLSQRPPPDLRSRADGSYVYSGPRFAAIIEADGTVRFNDRSNIGIDGMATDNGPGLSGSFDIMDALQGAAGQDPMRAERRWFMRETRELRERLMGQAQQRETGEGLARLERDLRAIWRGGGAAAGKRRQLFELWKDASEDEVGARARQAITAFIQRQLPAESADAFTDEELNTYRRLSGGRFRPYR